MIIIRENNVRVNGFLKYFMAGDTMACMERKKSHGI